MRALPKPREAEAFIRQHAPAALPAVQKAASSLWGYSRRNPRRALRIALPVFVGLLATKCEIQSWLTWHEITVAEPPPIWTEAFVNKYYGNVGVNSDARVMFYGSSSAYEEVKNADRLWRKWQNEYIDTDIAHGLYFFRNELGKYWIAEAKQAQAPQQAAYDAAVKQHDIGVNYQWAAWLLYLLAILSLPPRWLLVVAVVGGGLAAVGGVIWTIFFATSAQLSATACVVVFVALCALGQKVFDWLRGVTTGDAQPRFLGHSRFTDTLPSKVTDEEI